MYKILIGDQTFGISAFGHNITKEKQYERALQSVKELAEKKDLLYKTTLDTLCEGVTLNEIIFDENNIAVDFKIIETNKAFEQLIDKDQNEILNKKGTEIYRITNEIVTEYWVDKMNNEKTHSVDYFIPENKKWMRIYISSIRDNKFTNVHIDITDQINRENELRLKNEEIELNNLRLESLLNISQYQANSVYDLHCFTLEEAIKLTKSKIGQMYMYDECSQTFTRATWSKNAMHECNVASIADKISLEDIGLWGEAVRQRNAVIINNYREKNPLKRGLPQGHVSLTNFLAIPVIFDNKIVAVLGVANKKTDYDSTDVRQLSLLMDSVWKISERVELIKDLKQTQTELIQSKDLLQNIQSISQTGGWEYNLKTGKMYWTPEMYRIHELPETGEYYLMNEAIKCYPPTYCELIKKAFKKCINEGAPYNIEAPFTSKNNSFKWIRTSAQAIIENNEVVKIIGSITDISESKQIEKELIKAKDESEKHENELSIQNRKYEAINIELKQINNELFNAKQKAEENNRLKTAFLQNMSHEIRTPMNSIIGFSQMMLANLQNKEKLERFSKIVEQQCNALLGIINDLMEMSKIETGTMPIRFDTCELNKLFEEIAIINTDLQAEIGKKSIEFICKPNTNLEWLTIKTDIIKLKQIFNNLINNAFKFTEKGKIEASCFVDEKTRLIFYVSDTGIGIPENKQIDIFERFVKLEYENKLYGGNGLGLSIVKRLIDLLGGEIWIESVEGKGSTFFFTVGLGLQDIENNFIAEYSYLKPQMQLTQKCVLLVEDDDFNLEFLNEILQPVGCTLIGAQSGKDAMNAFSNHDFDLVLMDIGLPDTTGFDLTTKMLKIKPSIKIIAQTAYSTINDKRAAIDCGCIDYICKPIDAIKLSEMVVKYLS